MRPETQGRVPTRPGQAPGYRQRGAEGLPRDRPLAHARGPQFFPTLGPQQETVAGGSPQEPGNRLHPYRPTTPTNLVKLLLQGPALRHDGNLGLQVPVNRPVPKIRRANQRETGQAAPCQVQPEACREKEMCRQVSTAAATASPRHADLGEKQAHGVPGARGQAPVEDRLPGGPLSAPHTDLGGEAGPRGPGTWGLAPLGPAVSPAR